MNDLQMMKNPSKWVNEMILPLKKSTGSWPDLGLLVSILGEEPAPIIYKVNMFAIPSLKDILQAPKIQFSSLEEIVETGWMVD